LDNKNTKKKGVSPFELAGNLLKLKTRNTLLIIEGGAGESLAVLGERLGPRAILASQGSGGAGEPDGSAGRIARAIENGGKGRFLYASELIGLASLPLKDYPLFDRFLEPGELRISTLFPGTASVSAAEGAQSTATQGAQVAQIAALDSRFLDSLESAVFRLPEGRYAVTMIYRNSNRETRIAELANNGSADIAFTYRPTLRASDFRSPLPMFGVNIGELNPGNYRRADPAVLSQMGMEQHLISFLSGEKLYKAGDYDKAIAEYSRSINSKTDYADAYISRGNAYRKKGDLNRAIDDYTRALQYKNDLAEVYNYRAYAYAEKGEAGRAIDDYSRAIRIKKDYADAWYNRGYVYEEQGEYDKAIEDYNQVIRLEARNAAAYNRRGSAWYRKEDDDQAIRDYSEAVRLKPDYALAWRNRGNAWFSKGEFEKALADFNQALRIDPRSANAYISRGNLKKMMGDDEGAELDFAAAGRLR
jgi:tetratricopeptide (TPR) repeat protein